MSAPNPLLDAALHYAGMGWRVMPLHGINQSLVDPALCCTCQKGPDCKTPGKHPRIKTGRGYAAAATDPATIRAWWHRWPNSNVGIATGHAPETTANGDNPRNVWIAAGHAPETAANGDNPRLALCVLDIDGAEGARTLLDAIRASGLTAIPRTLQASSGRRDGGVHLYYFSDVCPQSSGNGFDSRGTGGLVVAPPSRHVTGTVYAWAADTPIARLPGELAAWLANRERTPRDKKQKPPVDLSGIPEHLRTRKSKRVNANLKGIRDLVPVGDIVSALAVMCNDDLGWDSWNRVLMTAWACDQSQEVLDACILWSRKSRKYTEGACEERWSAYAGSPPSELGFGTLCRLAREAHPDWSPPSHQAFAVSPDTGPTHAPPESAAVPTGHLHSLAAENSGPPPGILGADPSTEHQEGNGHTLNGHHGPLNLNQAAPSNPLIDLNKRYAVIRNIGHKMVMSMEPSEEDPSIRVPYFQTCSNIKEGYSNAYFATPADPDPKQLGAYWLKWTGRKTFDGLDLVPNKPKIINPGNILNLWDGFACQPAQGSWAAMQDHIFSVLAGGDAQAAEYIWRWMAWAVQNPADRAEVALVLRGGKGVGKGRFATWMKRLFGQHGLQIANSRHLTGNFNGHLRSCLLLFVDEAFWAGDKQGESILKTLLTEASFMLEQKGVDAKGWRNRLHVIMAANADWVVPASADERRYAVFDVVDTRVRDYDYFHTLESEMKNGGLPAMLHDLLKAPLGRWHPRQGIHTAALQAQKARSLDPYHEWLESMLQQGELPTVNTPIPDWVCSAGTLLTLAREAGGLQARNITANKLGRFLKVWGCEPIHRSQGSAWRFPTLLDLRKAWEARYGGWRWDIPLEKWNERNL